MDIEEGRKACAFSFFNELKVSTGYCVNPKRLVNMRELKFNNGPMKAHDYHVIMTQLLPIALRGILPPKVRAPIIKLCSFFNAISKKVIDVSTLEKRLLLLHLHQRRENRILVIILLLHLSPKQDQGHPRSRRKGPWIRSLMLPKWTNKKENVPP